MKDRRLFHTPAGTVGPLERGLIKATNSGENFEAWVVGFYGEWSDTLAKLPEKLADAAHQSSSFLRLYSGSLTRKLSDGRASTGENPRSNSERG